jgi:hypothetical protein
MSTFFIKVQDGVPVGNPMPLSSAKSLGYFEQDFREGEIPFSMEKFLPIDEPFFDWNEVLETDGKLHKIDESWQKVYQVRAMTAKELKAHQAECESYWASEKGPGYTNWTYSPEFGQMCPPVLPPDDIKNVEWDDKKQAWIGDPVGPEDAKIV